ncbi:MAG: hypothetical protein ABJZ69_06180, partial [Hyphomicrobiales bacterium]
YTKIGFMREIERGELKFVKLTNQRLGKYKVGLLASSTTSIDPAKHLFISAAERLMKQLDFDS